MRHSTTFLPRRTTSSNELDKLDAQTNAPFMDNAPLTDSTGLHDEPGKRLPVLPTIAVLNCTPHANEGQEEPRIHRVKFRLTPSQCLWILADDLMSS